MTEAQGLAMDRLMRRMPAGDRASFTTEHLAVLSRVLAARYAAPTLIDVRRQVRLGRWRWHVLLRVGVDRG